MVKMSGTLHSARRMDLLFHKSIQLNTVSATITSVWALSLTNALFVDGNGHSFVRQSRAVPTEHVLTKEARYIEVICRRKNGS